MDRRLMLDDILAEILGTKDQEETRVYFQPPSSIKLTYPCIIYSRIGRDEKFANNSLYVGKQQYAITVVDKDPDSLIPDKVGSLPLTRFVTHFTSDNLNHDVYHTYY